MQDILKRTKWMMKDRFGMFIHWGIYSISGRGVWGKSRERMTTEDYQRYFDNFNPVDYDPKKWAKSAKNAGMKYIVLTAKHHDGFCLFDTKTTDYNAKKTQAGRDLIKEYVEAVRDEGLKVGLYYSLLDWYHEDYPHYGDMHHPMRDNKEFEHKEHNFDRYLDYMHEQVREICSNYGKIDILWFDFSYGEMYGEKWRAIELIKMVRSLQPNVIINNRLETSGEGYGSLIEDIPLSYSGDFVSPEQILPSEGFHNIKGKEIPWELCVTSNNTWAYNPYDRDYKTAGFLVKKLVECVSKGGNMLLNIGPDARGNLSTEGIEILEGIGNWMKKNGESIYGCGYANLEKPEWGRYTKNGNTIYAHIFEGSIGPLVLSGLTTKDIKFITRLADGTEILSGDDAWNAKMFKGKCFVYLCENESVTRTLQDEMDTVLKIKLK